MARRSLGTLTLDLIAQIGGFEKGMDKAQRKSKSSMGAIQKHAKTAAKAVAGIGIAAVGATAALIKSQANAADELIKTSRAVGVEVESLSALKYQAELSGVAFNNLTTGLRTFSKNARDAGEGTGEAVDTFEAIGVSLYGMDGQLKTSEQLLGEVADAFAGMEDGMLKTAYAQDLMGRSGAQMINLLNGGSAGIAAARKEAESLGQVLDRETAEGAEAFNDALTRVNKSLFGNFDLLDSLTPAMGELADTLNKPETIENLRALAAGIGDVAVNFINASIAVVDFAEDLGERVAKALYGPADLLERQIEKAKDLEADLERLRNPSGSSKGGFGGDVKAFLDKDLEKIAEVEKELAAVNVQIADLRDQKALEQQAEQAFRLFEYTVKVSSAFDVFGNSGEEAGTRTADGFKKASKEIEYAADVIASATTVDEFGFAGNENPLTWVEDVTGDFVRATEAEKEFAAALKATLDPLGAFESQAEKIRGIFDKGLLGDTTQSELDAYLDKLREAAGAGENVGGGLAETFGSIEGAIGGAVNELSKVQGAMEDGSKGAKQLEHVMTALSVAQGAAAIANAMASGDPYTAVARAVAVAATLASAGINTGVSGGAAAVGAQAAQGTGGVLGDSSAQSESIMNAVDITADATSKLPGLARAQLEALKSMQAGIGGASNIVLRTGNNLPGAPESEGLFESIGIGSGSFFLDSLLGGSSSVINSGIEIAGGRINDLINNTVVSAFEDIEEKKNFLDDKDVRRVTELLGDDVGRQFSLVFASMADAVTEAADVLGMSQAQIQNRIDRFRVAATEISTMDLDSEESQAALEAVFSDIFDRLATAVVPNLAVFQVGGEALAETLIRVATQVQVADEIMGQLGNTLLESFSGQSLAVMSDDLIQAAGGLENFMSIIGDFIDTFATEEHKLNIATNSINSAFSQMGLTVPDTRDAVWSLMQGLTDPAQIARLAELTDSLDTYFSALENEGQEAAALASQQQALEIQLLRAQGDAEAALSLERERALEKMDKSLHAIQRQIWLEQDLASVRDSFFASADAVFASTDSAMQALRAAVDVGVGASAAQLEAESAAITADHEARVASVNSWFDSIINRYQRRMQSLQESVSALTGLSGSLESAIDSLRNKTAASEQANYFSAVSQLGSLASGVAGGSPLPGADVINRLAGNLGNGADQFADYRDFVQGNAEVLRDLQFLQGEASEQLSVEERMLAVAEHRAESAERQHQVMLAREDERLEKELAEAQARHDIEVAELEKQYKQFEEEINILRGIDTRMLDVGEAANGVAEAINNEASLRNVQQSELRNALRDGFESNTRSVDDVFRTLEQFLEEWRDEQENAA